MIESLEQMKRRAFALQIAMEIVHHPAFPHTDEFPRAMIVIIDRGLAQWEAANHGA